MTTLRTMFETAKYILNGLTNTATKNCTPRHKPDTDARRMRRELNKQLASLFDQESVNACITDDMKRAAATEMQRHSHDGDAAIERLYVMYAVPCIKEILIQRVLDEGAHMKMNPDYLSLIHSTPDKPLSVEYKDFLDADAASALKAALLYRTPLSGLCTLLAKRGLQSQNDIVGDTPRTYEHIIRIHDETGDWLWAINSVFPDKDQAISALRNTATILSVTQNPDKDDPITMKRLMTNYQTMCHAHGVEIIKLCKEEAQPLIDTLTVLHLRENNMPLS